MRFSHLFLPICLLVTAAAAQNRSTGMATPTMGFIFDSNERVIRPIRGIPGAAVPGEALDLDFPIRTAGISPRQDFALLVSDMDQRVRLTRLPDGATSLLPAEAGPERIVFSPSGRSVMLYLESLGQMQIVTGLPDAPEVHALVAMPPLPQSIADDGMVISAGQDSGWPASTVVLAFRPGSRDLVAMTRAGDVYFAQGVQSATPGFRLVYRGDGATSDPVAVQLSSDGLRAHAVNREGLDTIVDLAAGSAQSISCQCRPVTLHPLGLDGMFRLTELADRPLMLVEASGMEPRVWFVPPYRAASDFGGINQ